MQLSNTKLFEIIRALSATERDNIPNFIASPVFFKYRGKILDLYVIIRREIEKYESGQGYLDTEEKIYEHLMRKEWNQTMFDSPESRLMRVIKKAIVYHYAGIETLKWSTEPENKELEIKELLYLARFYRERKLDQQFSNTIKRLKILQKKPTLSNDYYQNRYLIANEEYQATSQYRSSDREIKRLAVLERLDLAYIVDKLAILLESEPFVQSEIEQALQNLDNLSHDPNSPARHIVNVYRKAFNLTWNSESEDKALLSDYLEALELNSPFLLIEQQKNLYIIARNFCVNQYKKGKMEYLTTLFELLKKNLKEGFLYNKVGTFAEGLPLGAFQNIITNALKLQETEWTLTFLQKHKTKIIASSLEEQERFYNFGMACYHFHQKEYDAALRLLKTNFDDDRYRLITRALQIKLYFEKTNKQDAVRVKDKDFDFLYSRIGAFETYLTREPVGELDKLGYRNFIKIVKKLIKLQTVTDDDLSEKENLAEREWILEKVAQRKEWKKKILFKV